MSINKDVYLFYLNINKYSSISSKSNIMNINKDAFYLLYKNINIAL